MLGKLIKYEFLGTGRQLIPAYVGVLLFAVLSRISMEIMGGYGIFEQGLTTPWMGIVFGMLMLFYGLSIFAVVVLTIVLIIRRFYTNLFRDEGYLTNTLPVSVDGLIWGKLIPAVSWSIVSILVTLASVAIIFGGLIAAAIDAFGTYVNWDAFWNDLFGAAPMLLLTILSGIVALMAGILSFYSALSIGQLAKRHKILLAIGAFMGMSFIFSTLYSILGASLAIQYFTMQFDNYGFIAEISPRSVVAVSYGLVLAINLSQGAVHYFITRYIMKNRLNLE